MYLTFYNTNKEMEQTRAIVKVACIWGDMGMAIEDLHIQFHHDGCNYWMPQKPCNGPFVIKINDEDYVYENIMISNSLGDSIDDNVYFKLNPNEFCQQLESPNK